MTQNSQHKALSLRYAFAYAGTLALVASAAFFPSVSADATFSSLRGFVFAHGGNYAQSAIRSKELGRSTVRSYYSWVMLLALIGGCVLASRYRAAHPKTQFNTVSCVNSPVHSRGYFLPLIRGPSL